MALPALPRSTKDYQEVPSYADLLWVIRAVLMYIVTVMECSQDRIPQQFRHANVSRKESPSITPWTQLGATGQGTPKTQEPW